MSPAPSAHINESCVRRNLQSPRHRLSNAPNFQSCGRLKRITVRWRDFWARNEMTYDLLAHFYDLENADFIEDLDFWVGLAKESGGPVLELGCGSGRVTQQIAPAGITIVGLDHSEPMLALARAKLNRKSEVAARATLVCGDMTNFNLAPTPNSNPHHFPLIIVPFNTFMHLLTVTDQLAMLTCSRKHLITGGKLVLDLTNPASAYADPPAETLTLERTFRDD